MSTGTDPQWDIADLQAHLRYAADLEFWTIPFYIAAMYSVHSGGDAQKLIMSVAAEEMFHFQCACNIANAFNAFPSGYQFPMPTYSGQNIPHLNFALDQPNPATAPVHYPPDGGPSYDFTNYSAELGPANTPRIHAMCLIEYPNWNPLGNNEKQDTVTAYGSLGHFYEAVKIGIQQNKSSIKGNQKQQDLFGGDFPGMSTQTITEDGDAGYSQIMELISAITEQGEGRTSGDDTIPTNYQSHGGFKYEPEKPHFEKFLELYNNPPAVTQPTKPIEPAIQLKLKAFLEFLAQVFVEGDTAFSFTPMDAVKMAIQNCYPS